ncbi:MAG: glycosyltransferase family 4 protein [Pirellulales bacterium]
MFALGLAALADYEVSFAVFDQGQPTRERIEGIALFTLPRSRSLDERWLPHLRERVHRREGFPWLSVESVSGGSAALLWELPLAAALRAIEPLRRRLYLQRLDYPPRRRALAAIDADVYCTLGTHHITAEVVAFCRRRRRKSLLLLSSDYDLLTQYYSGSRERNIYGEVGHVCHYGLAGSDRIIAQTDYQRALLKSRFGRESDLVANPIDLSDTPPPAPRAAREGHALWVGKADDYKRPELCLELADRCPGIPFKMIVNRAAEGRFERVVEARGPNVEVIEQVPPHKMGGFFRGAAVLVNTSAYEGFPNTFLEAGKFGVPVVSLVADPDGFLSKHGCGIAAGGSLDRMAEALRLLWSGGPSAERFSQNIRTYVETHHDRAKCVADFEAVVRQLGDAESSTS